MSDQSALLLDALQARFGDRWFITVDGTSLRVEPKRPSRGVPRRRGAAGPAGAIHAIEHRLAGQGIFRDQLLPVRWHRDTDLTISAVQALDPWLKDGESRVWREGFLPQPVVRFTGERGADGKLLDGFLTSFVNLSVVKRITNVGEHVRLLDAWISAFSAAGLHAGRLTMHGDLNVWRRDTVAGITIHIDADTIGIGDAVLLWNANQPERLATDLGSGLERLLWTLTGMPWARVVFGDLAAQWEVTLLDAIRTATLLTMSGIRPAPRGPGSALRRVLSAIPANTAQAGLSRLVRTQRAYWTQTAMTGLEWPEVCRIIEDEVSARANSSSASRAASQ
jgi:hypothetical protein